MKFVVWFLFIAGLVQSQELAPTTPPQVIARGDPEYTKEAAAAKTEGTVVPSTVIDPDGNATGITIVKSLDPGLDLRAIECVEKWQFRPAMHRGEPISMRATVEINFRLTVGKAPNRN